MVTDDDCGDEEGGGNGSFDWTRLTGTCGDSGSGGGYLVERRDGGGGFAAPFKELLVTPL